MSEIQEIPIEAEDPPENTQEILAPIPENPEEIQPVPKKRGRPAGSKNVKPAPKPKPKAKQKKPVDYVEYTESEEEEAPPPRRRTEEPVKWTDMLWPATCSTFCSSDGISERLQSATTMLAGLRIRNSKVNGEETDDKQSSSSRKVDCDPTTERAEASEGHSHEQVAD